MQEKDSDTMGSAGRAGRFGEHNVNMVWSRERCGRGELLEGGALDRGWRDGDVQGGSMAEARECGAREGEVQEYGGPVKVSTVCMEECCVSERLDAEAIRGDGEE